MVAGVRVSCELGCLCGWCWLYHNRCVWGLPFIWLQLCLQVLWRDIEFLLFAFGRFRFTLPTATITAAAQTAAAVAACDEPTEHKQGLQRTKNTEIVITCVSCAMTTEFVRLGYRIREKNHSSAERELSSYSFVLHHQEILKIMCKSGYDSHILHWGEYCQPGLLEWFPQFKLSGLFCCIWKKVQV